MRAAVPAVLSVAFVLVGLGIFVGGRQAARQADAPAAGAAGTRLPPAKAAVPEIRRPPPGRAASRQIAPDVVAPPELDTGELDWAAPRPPLSDPLPPKQEEKKGGKLFRPLAVESAVVEAMGMKVTIAGTDSLSADETCEFAGQPWACGMRARTAFRMWLRGRALDCDLPPDAGDGAAPGGRYAEAEAEARAAKKGIFGPPPDLSGLPAAAGTTASAAASGSMPSADQPVPAR